MTKKKLPWFRSWGDNRFELKSCKMVKEYICYMTDLEPKQVEVHKTQRYLVVTLATSDGLRVEKIELPGSVLYCLDPEHFEPLWKAIECPTSD